MRLRSLLLCGAFLALPWAAQAGDAYRWGPDWSAQVLAGASRTPAAGGRSGPALFVDAVHRGYRPWNLQPAVSVGVIGGKGTARDQANRTVGVLAAGVRVWSPWGLFLQEQGAVIGPRTQALSSTGQFVTSLGWQGERLSVQVRHISNGGTHGKNAGETMALVGWVF